MRLAASFDDGPNRALIEAVVLRYASPQPEDRAPLDQAFADVMAEAYRRFPDDGDVGALYAEALLDLHPWDLWTHAGEPKEWTPRIVEVLEDVLGRHPEHPLALHLYIHAVEASSEPGRADAAADALRDLTPGLGHMVHMPSHIDVRRGRWEEAIIANTRAIEADRAYREAAPAPPDFYRLYMSHNHHMKAYAAMMIGRSEVALTSIRELVADIPDDWLKANASWADGFVAMPYEVLMRFGRWQEILEEPEPPSYIPLTRSLHFAARAVALAALGRPEEARAEQRAFLEARTAVAADAIFGNNRAHDILDVADRLVEGEILYREGKKDEGINALYEAAAREDQLRYDEPPDWIQPVRHALGATLLMERRHAEAESVYQREEPRETARQWLVAVRPRAGAAAAGEDHRGRAGRGPVCGSLGGRGHRAALLLLLPARSLSAVGGAAGPHPLVRAARPGTVRSPRRRAAAARGSACGRRPAPRGARPAAGRGRARGLQWGA